MADDSRAMGILRRSADVLELVAERGGLSVAEVAERVEMPRASVYRLTEALVQARLVELGADGKVRASLRCVRLADAARAGQVEWSGARKVLDSLSDLTGQTTFLSVPTGQNALCIDWSRGRGISVLALKPGRTLPLYAGAAGRVTLAFRPEPIDDYLASGPFPALTSRTLTEPAELRKDVEATRVRGYSVSDEDVTLGIGALGVPVLAGDGSFAAALSVAGLAEELRTRRTELAAALSDSAQQLLPPS